MTDKNIHWSLSLKARILTKLNKPGTKKDRDFNLLLFHLENAFENFEDEIPNGLIFLNENIEEEEQEDAVKQS
jgi:hypothetical protein